MKKKAKILVVDSDASFIDFIAKTLQDENTTLHSVKSADEAMAELARKSYNLIITDVILPGIDGLKLLEMIKIKDPSIDVIFCTRYSSVESAVKALKEGAYDYIIKPVDADEIRLVVHRCLEQRIIYEENEELKKMVQLIEACKSISTTFDKAKISNSALDILIKETDASMGFFVTCGDGRDDDKFLDIVSFKGVPSSKINKFNQLFTMLSKNWKRKRDNTFHLKKDELSELKKHYRTLKDGMVIKIQGNSKAKALIILLNNTKKGNFTPSRIKYVPFINRETTMALSNLDQYLGAKELAYIDDLTDLYNSRYLHLILDREIKRAKRFKTTLLLLFIDLDQFKKVNDTHGHLVGGKVLIEMANVLMTCVREIDTVVRYGGDEYIIVLTETEIETGMMVAERVRRGIEEHVFLKDEGFTIKLTACIGVAAYPEHAVLKKDLIHLADMAMYMGKETTRNAVYIATEKVKNN